MALNLFQQSFIWRTTRSRIGNNCFPRTDNVEIRTQSDKSARMDEFDCIFIACDDLLRKQRIVKMKIISCSASQVKLGPRSASNQPRNMRLAERKVP